jgi:NAD-dependent SIR2 family protein deacetylase
MEETAENDGHDEPAVRTLSDYLSSMAQAQGIPLLLFVDQLLQQKDDDEDEDSLYWKQQLHRLRQHLLESAADEVVNYPFDTPQSLADVARFIQSDACRGIVVLSGAGMSVSSGIPDFRSHGSGLYHTLRPERLTASQEQQQALSADPTAVFDLQLFKDNPLPLLEVNRPFILGVAQQQWKATLAHRFVELLHTKTDKLVRWYTQNIDGLEDQCTQLPRDKVVCVHGSMDRVHCTNCTYTQDSLVDFAPLVQRCIKDVTGADPTAPRQSTPLTCPSCAATTLKPDIVLFGSPLPRTFYHCVGPDTAQADLVIVLGTSLLVAPANSIVVRVPATAMRVVINRQVVGRHLGLQFPPEESDDDETNSCSQDGESSNAGSVTDQAASLGPSRQNGGRDFFAGGDCEDIVLELAQHLGWLSDFQAVADRGALPEASARLLQEKLQK